MVGILAVLGGLVLLTLVGVTPWASQIARKRVIAALSEQLDGEVTLGAFQLRVLPHVHIVGGDLVVRHRGRHDVPPLISIRHFVADASIYGAIHGHIDKVSVIGLDLEIPPKPEEGRALPDTTRRHPTPRGVTPHSHQRPAADTMRAHPPPKVDTARQQRVANNEARTAQPAGAGSRGVLDELVANQSRLVLLPRNPADPAKTWEFHQIAMHQVAAGRRIAFDGTLTNPLPPGEVTTSGTFGPWQKEDPSATSLTGTYRLEHADLSVFKGITGDILTVGTFFGQLDYIDIHGHVTTPKFTLALSGLPVPLKADYHTIVDGTTGTTTITEVDGSFANTAYVAKGEVFETATKTGHAVGFDVTMEHARVEDILRLTVKSPKPPMTGEIWLKTKFLLAPGPEDVVRRLTLDGMFTSSNTRFTSPDVTKRLVELSRRSRGKAADSTQDTVSAQFSGGMRLRRGVLSIPWVTFRVPGAFVRLGGTYDMIPDTLHFKGVLYMNVKVSETQTGIKRFLLKIVDPMFRSEFGGSAIPIKITGPRSNPQYGLDKDALFNK